MTGTIRRMLVGASVVSVASTTVLRAELTLVEGGQPSSAVVVPTEPCLVVRYAAEELQLHIEKATGVRLQCLREDQVAGKPGSYVFLGPCEATRNAGVDGTRAEPDGFVIKTVGDDLFIAGGDDDGDPLQLSTHAGTLFGVYELVESVLNVRWLWPGKLGEHIPTTSRVAVPEMDRTWAPQLQQRNLRRTLASSRLRGKTAYSRDALKQVLHDEAVWLRRQRMGRYGNMRYGHAFTSWWQRYGETNPEYFNQLETGRREPLQGPKNVSMCVSEPAFRQRIVENWLAAKERPPNVNVCENDTHGLCCCERCLAWDEPLPPTPSSSRYLGPNERVVTNRYARFYLAVQQLAAQHVPDTRVIGYAYVNYFPAPDAAVKLNKQVLIGLVPDTFFPRTTAEQSWVLAQWEGWGNTGASLFLRPNYFLDGYCMPHIFAHQFGAEFAHAARNGMMATDFDSLTSMWSAQGPNLYLLGRMHVRPQADVEALLDEYYAGFGPAASAVRAYFSYWERLLQENVTEWREAKLGWSGMPKSVHTFYTPPRFAEGARLLTAAVSAADGDDLATARVRFLHKGFEHARLSAETAAAVAASKANGNLTGFIEAILKLDEYRRSIERDNVANLGFCAWTEQRAWDRDLAGMMKGREIVLQLPLEWKMRWDPDEVGQQQKWFAPDADQAAWLPVRTDAAWEKQAVGEAWKADHGIDYNGLAWYRVAFPVAKEQADVALALIFGAVDEGATVWLNGEHVGTHPFKKPEDWYVPFEMDVAKQLRIGAPNELVVLVEDRSGLGGVWKPVFLVRDARPTETP